jgi:hypothetical protein
MGTWHGYFGIEALSMTGAQKTTLLTALRALGPTREETDWPPFLMQFRPRLDNNAAIFEARFNDANLTVAALKQFLADAFAVPVANISNVNTSVTFARLPSPIVTLRSASTDRLRVVLFAGVGATWAESREECAAYLAANRAAWEPAQP